jgi:hypothetical protein
MKRSTVLGLAGAGILVMAMAPTYSGATSGSITQPNPTTAAQTLRFHAPPFTQTRVPEPSSPDAGFSAGDRLFWVAELYVAADHVGSAPHACTAVNGNYLTCQASALLPKGEVEFQVSLDINSSVAGPIPVIGGSGCYRDARGQLLISFNADGSADWTLQLDDACRS